MRMAEMFPELESEGDETAMPWDYNNEFRCSNLAVYFEVNCPGDPSDIVHPESVERLTDQGSTMKFYESSRALKGDEGAEMANVVQAMERRKLHKQRKAWKKKHGSLWAKPDPLDVVRIHPAVTVRDILADERMVVANVSALVMRHLFGAVLLLRASSIIFFQFLMTLVMIPETHSKASQ